MDVCNKTNHSGEEEQWEWALCELPNEREIQVPFFQSNERAERDYSNPEVDYGGLFRLSLDLDDERFFFEFEFPPQLGQLLLNNSGEKPRLVTSAIVELLAFKLGKDLSNVDFRFGRSILKLSATTGPANR
jgi:hypothetical protein